MNSFSHNLKSYLNILILILIFLIGAMITYLNLSYSFNLSISSKNKKAIFAEERLNRYEGLKLISMKNLNELTKNDISKIQRWLDEKGKSKSELIENGNKLNINISYYKDFDLADYLNKLFSIPNKEIKNLKIKNKENQITIGLY